MKHFIVKQETTVKAGIRRTTTTLWVVKRNIPVKLGVYHSTYESPNQAIMNCAETLGALPAKWFERHPMGGFAHVPWSLAEAGIATFHCL